MDWIRTILFIAIAGVGLVLVNEWTAFKQVHRAATLIEPEPVATPSLAAFSDIDTPLPVDDDELPSAAVDSDLPVVQTEASGATAAAPASIVRVTTDVLIADINLVGGDIVRIALPQQLAQAGKPEPFVLLEQNSRRTYIAQSGLIGKNGTDTREGRPTFQSGSTSYQLAAGENNLVVDLLTSQADDAVQITKRFTFSRGEHLVKVDYLVDNQSDSPWQASLYAQLKRDNSEDPGADSSGMGMKPFLGVASRTEEKPYAKIALPKLGKEPLNSQVENGWIAMVQHYFVSAWVPGDERSHHYSTKVTSRGDNLIRFTGPALTLPPGQQGELGAQFYAGPKDQYRLKEIAAGLDLTVDYGFLWPIAQPLFWLLTKFHNVVGNWGWSIILLTLLVKALFFHLSAASYRSMAKMRAVAPKMTLIRETYADDKQKQSQEMMALYKKEKVNPLGGCLPILIQMPVFIALYWVLMESVELRHAPWLGWITDLSARDPYFILPIIMGASMWFQQKLNPPPPDPMQAKIMQMLPIVFTFFFLLFPSGLVLYWVVNNLLSILQQWIITRRIEREASA